MRPIYVSATVQDSGKTSVSVGLMQVLRERQLDPGYTKPVGQHYVPYHNEKIDEDAVLVHKVFSLADEPVCLSPIAIERGFTTRFILNPVVAPLEERIRSCADRLLEAHGMLIVEGTGHAGVGSCFGLSNARVAELLGAKAVIVTGGGIGKPIDEVAVSLALFRDHNVPVIGVILNKILPEKYDKVRNTVAKGLEHLGTRLIGAIPFDPSLTFFTMAQLAEELKCRVLWGADALGNRIEKTVVAAMEPHHVVPYIQHNTLVIAPGDRIDNILLAIMVMARSDGQNGGIVLTGDIEPHESIVPLLESSGIPVLLTKDDTFTVSSKISALGFKIRSFDNDKIAMLHRLVGAHVDTDAILAALAD